MKCLTYILILWFVVAGCNSSDDFSGGEVEIFPEPVFDLTTIYGKKQLEFYENYGIVFLDKLDINFYVFDWTTIQHVVADETTLGGFNVTQADTSYIGTVLDFLDTEIFEVLGENFVKNCCPRYIQLLDMCGASAINYLLDGVEPKARMYPGWGNVAVNYLALGGVSNRFGSIEKKELKRKWVSLFIEKAYEKLPFSEDFALLYNEGWALDSWSTMALGDYSNYAFLQIPRNSSYLLGIHEAFADVSKVTLEQDFGDFAAAVLVYTEEELMELAKLNPLIASKIEVMKNYVKENFE